MSLCRRNQTSNDSRLQSRTLQAVTEAVQRGQAASMWPLGGKAAPEGPGDRRARTRIASSKVLGPHVPVRAPHHPSKSTGQRASRSCATSSSSYSTSKYCPGINLCHHAAAPPDGGRPRSSISPEGSVARGTAQRCEEEREAELPEGHLGTRQHARRALQGRALPARRRLCLGALISGTACRGQPASLPQKPRTLDHKRRPGRQASYSGQVQHDHAQRPRGRWDTPKPALMPPPQPPPPPLPECRI